jgi:hypothetical protein
MHMHVQLGFGLLPFAWPCPVPRGLGAFEVEMHGTAGSLPHAAARCCTSPSEEGCRKALATGCSWRCDSVRLGVTCKVH